jgi:sugar-specific transcriptional regulator TrmB
MLILDLISSRYNIIILSATTRIPKTGKEISEKYDIPLTQTYHIIQRLVKMKLLKEKGKKFENGHISKTYLSQLLYLKINIKSQKMIIEYQLRNQEINYNELNILEDLE